MRDENNWLWIFIEGFWYIQILFELWKYKVWNNLIKNEHPCEFYCSFFASTTFSWVWNSLGISDKIRAPNSACKNFFKRVKIQSH